MLRELNEGIKDIRVFIVFYHFRSFLVPKLLILCELYKRHDIAEEKLKGPMFTEQLIEYIQRSSDYLPLGKKHFKTVLTTLPLGKKVKTAEMFCSPLLTETEVNEILAFIGEKSEINRIITTKIIEYAAYNNNTNSPHLHLKLIKILNDLLADVYNFSTGTIVPIQSEKEENRAYRTSLLRILETSDCYQLVDIADYIEKMGIEECFAAYRKLKNFDKCVELIDKCVEIIKKYPTKYEVLLAEVEKIYQVNDPAAKQIYNKFVQLLLTHCKSATKSRRKAFQQVDPNLLHLIDLLNTSAGKIDPEALIGQLPTDLPLNKLKGFLLQMMCDRVDKLRLLRIENALLKKTIMEKKKHVEFLKGGYVEVKETQRCIVCGGKIEANSVFYVLSNNTTVHAACNQKTKI